MANLQYTLPGFLVPVVVNETDTADYPIPGVVLNETGTTTTRRRRWVLVITS